MGDYKLIDGYPGFYQGWYKPDQVDHSYYSNVPVNFTGPFADKMMLFNLKGFL
jgi:predicted DNA-binding ArsR family transcriptional regulator